MPEWPPRRHGEMCSPSAPQMDFLNLSLELKVWT
jgi:hypothetical protein